MNPRPAAETARTAAKAVKPTLGEFAPHQLCYFRTAVPQRSAKGEGGAKSTCSLKSCRHQCALCRYWFLSWARDPCSAQSCWAEFCRTHTLLQMLEQRNFCCSVGVSMQVFPNYQAGMSVCICLFFRNSARWLLFMNLNISRRQKIYLWSPQ